MKKLFLTLVLALFASAAGLADTNYYAVTQNGEQSSGLYVIVDWDYPYTAQLPWQAGGGETCVLIYEEEDDSRTVYEIYGAGTNGGRFFLSVPKDSDGDEDRNYCLVEFFANMMGSYSKLLTTWCSTTPSRGSSSSSGGYYDNYGSRGSSSGSSSSACRICGGSGVCTSCHGQGGEWRDTGYYTGSGSRSWIACPSCNGNKRCFNCHGTGRQ